MVILKFSNLESLIISAIAGILLNLKILTFFSEIFVAILKKTNTVDPGCKKLAYKKYRLIVNVYLGPDWQFHYF